jgi:hypothetical protein
MGKTFKVRNPDKKPKKSDQKKSPKKDKSQKYKGKWDA